MTAFLNNIYRKFFNKKTHAYCKYISDAIYFDYNNNVRFCPYTDFGVIKREYDGIWLNVEDVKVQRINCSKVIQSEEIHEYCKDCFCLEQSDNKIEKKPLKYVYLAHWKFCSLNCLYCDFPKNDDFIKAKHYDILPTIKQLIDSGLINSKTTFIFECGDACTHPDFDKLIYYLLNYECKNIIVKTSAMRFCQSIADLIGRDKGEVYISLDSATRFMYEKIKRLDKFNDAIQNTKRYLSHQLPKEKNVVLSYIMLNAINDNEKELLDWVILAKELGINKLFFDIEMKWYNSIRYSVPKYLKDIIIYIKNMADYNNIEIEFGTCASVIYNTVKQEEKNK